MKIGIRVPSPELGVELDPAFVACVAEELGFESIWYPEHTILPVSTQARYTWSAGTGGEEIPQAYSAFVDPFIALAHASAATTKLKLGSGVTLIPERNPLLLAKEVATLDRFSGGLRLGKRMVYSNLRWLPWQSLASRRVPSLAWGTVTCTAKRRQEERRPKRK